MLTLSVQRFPARNLPALLRYSASCFGSRRFLREINPESPNSAPAECTFEQFEQAVASTAEFLAQAGVKPFDRVLFVAENSRDYQVLALAAQALRAEPCSVFANLGTNATCDIALRVRPRCLFVSSERHWDKLSPIASTLIESGLMLRVSPKPLEQALRGVRDCLSSEIASTPYERAIWNGRVDAIGPNDPFLILFTSGTTGKQKGVVLRQDAFVRAIEGGNAVTVMTEADDGLMFLPFAHIAGVCQFMLAIATGHSLILASRREDLPIAFSLHPTYSFAVPMVYEKVVNSVKQQLRTLSWPLRPLLLTALSAASHAPATGAIAIRNRALTLIAQKTIGKQLRQNLGGRLRLVASGGVSAPPSLCRFFEAMGIPFISFYGMSETSGLISSQSISEKRDSDSVGLPSPDLEIKISNSGELCLKGALMMAGYLDAEDNETAYDEQGYFRTGDLVTRDENSGRYHIVGRSKNLLILSTGKKISPEPIEAQLEATWPFSGAVLIGDGRPYVTAILFVPGDTFNTLGGDEAAILTRIQSIAKRHLGDFSDYERPKRFLVLEGSPSDYPEFVTPTLKLKRAPIVETNAAAITQLYDLATGYGILRRR